MADHRYPLTYDIHHEDPPLTGEQVKAGTRGAADALVVLSMIYPEDGSFSLEVSSLDGRTNADVTDKELWKVWAMLAYRLAQSTTLEESKRSLAQTLHECVATAIAVARLESV